MASNALKIKKMLYTFIRFLRWYNKDDIIVKFYKVLEALSRFIKIFNQPNVLLFNKSLRNWHIAYKVIREMKLGSHWKLYVY